VLFLEPDELSIGIILYNAFEMFVWERRYLFDPDNSHVLKSYISNTLIPNESLLFKTS